MAKKRNQRCSWPRQFLLFFFSFSWELKLYFGKSERFIFVNWLIYIYVFMKILDRTYFLKLYENVWGFPDDSVGKESACNVGEAGDVGSIPGSGRSPGEGMATRSSILAWESHGQRGLVGYSSQHCKELDMTGVTEDACMQVIS